jgi:hypothetical protein
MNALSARTPRPLAGALMTLLIVTACSSGAIATPTPTISPMATPSATPTPTLRPTLRPTLTPGPSRKPDASAGLKIGAPYALVANPLNQGLSATFSFDIAGQHVEASMNGREIRKGGAMVGVALVLQFTGIPMSTALFESSAQGGARNAGGTLSYTKILGTRVAVITTKQATVEMYALGDVMVMVGGDKPADSRTLMTSIIKANQ